MTIFVLEMRLKEIKLLVQGRPAGECRSLSVYLYLMALPSGP